jgi:uncharacterized protein YjiK
MEIVLSERVRAIPRVVRTMDAFGDKLPDMSHTISLTFEFDGMFDIPTVRRDASALTVHAVTQHLWTITDDEIRLVEFTREGRFVRELELKGFKDTEGMSHIDGDRFLIAEEKAMRITLIEVPPEGSKIRVIEPVIRLDVKSKKNKGLEGISYDAKTDTLYAVREDKPPEVFRVHPVLGGGPAVTKSWPLDLEDFDDLSDTYFDPRTGWLWLLSHESQAAAAFDANGSRVVVIELKKGRHGLPEDVVQAEGIAIDGSGTIFICSEPNRIYRFRPN